MGVYFVFKQALSFIVIPEILHGDKWSTKSLHIFPSLVPRRTLSNRNPPAGVKG